MPQMTIRNPYRPWLQVVICLTAAVLLSGCAVVKGGRFAGSAQRPAESHLFFTHLDAAVGEAGVGNGAYARLAGFPYLRTDRFLSAYKNRLMGAEQNEAWLKRLLDRDRSARVLEIDNLPADAVREVAQMLRIPASRSHLKTLMVSHGHRLLRADQIRADFWPAVMAAATVPGEYRTAYRILGFYPLAALPVIYLTARAHTQFREWHATPLDRLPVAGTLEAFALRKGSAVGLGVAEIHHLFRTAPLDALGLPRFSLLNRRRLAEALAPVILQDVAAPYDRFGAVRWARKAPEVVASEPTLYYYFTPAFIRNTSVWQINYAFWYSGRRGPAAPWIERGSLDGITLRITLDPWGQPIAADIMNNCGCYHFFAPRQDRVAEIVTVAWGLDPFTPTWLPEDFPNQRLTLRINSGWHQVDHLAAATAPENAKRYHLRPYETLESLPRDDGRQESLFSPQGIAKNSSRIEPYLLFSMGIPQVGSMRQRGHHALKLVGRAHFDDPYLMDRNFLFK